MSLRAVGWGMWGMWGMWAALIAVVAMPSRPASAGDRDAVADAVGRVMEAATTRMKAALEEARLLEAAGRCDDARALLRTVPAIHDEANRVVRTLVGGAAAPRPTPVPPARFEGPLEGPGVRPPPTPPISPPKIRARAKPKVDPVRPAVMFLLRCQRPDGMFDPRLGAAPGDPGLPDAPEDVLLEHATGAVLLALLDVSDARVDRDTPVGRAIVRAADALAARAAPSSPAPLQTLAAWGLATAVSRTGEARWMPAVLRSLESTLEDRAPTLGTDFPSTLADLVVFAAGFLHEVLALPADATPTARIAAALAALRQDVRGFPRTRLRTPAQRLAHDLLARDPASPGAPRFHREPDVDPDATLGRSGDPVEVLLGTVQAQAVFGFHDEAEGSAWWDDVLVPAMDRQARTGPTAGSWDPPAGPASAGSGRVVTTAFLLLAWKVPSTPFLAPVPWASGANDDANDGDDGGDDDGGGDDGGGDDDGGDGDDDGGDGDDGGGDR